MDYKRQAEDRLRSGTYDKYSLPDITGVSIPAGDDRAKISAFLQAAGNPYLFRVGDIGVHVVFSGEDGDTLQGRIRHLLRDLI